MEGGPKRERGPSLKVFVEYLAYGVFRVLEEFFCWVPSDNTALAVGRFFGRLMFVVAAPRRQVAIENLTTAFGEERSSQEIQVIARKNFEHLAMLGVEFFRIRRWSQEKLAEKLVLEGHEPYNLAWMPGREGRFYITAHFGTFEVLAATSRFLGLRGNLIVTPAPNRFVNVRMFFRRGGDESGLNILPHRGIVGHVIELLRAGEMVVVLADQRGDDNRPIWVRFFGKNVLANGVFAKLAIEGNAHVFAIMALRTDDGRYRCVFGEEIPIARTGNMQADLVENSQRFHRVFETWLREHPEQGFWMHRKFKRREKRPSTRGLRAFYGSHIQHDGQY